MAAVGRRAGRSGRVAARLGQAPVGVVDLLGRGEGRDVLALTGGNGRVHSSATSALDLDPCDTGTPLSFKRKIAGRQVAVILKLVAGLRLAGGRRIAFIRPHRSYRGDRDPDAHAPL